MGRCELVGSWHAVQAPTTGSQSPPDGPPEGPPQGDPDDVAPESARHGRRPQGPALDVVGVAPDAPEGPDGDVEGHVRDGGLPRVAREHVDGVQGAGDHLGGIAVVARGGAARVGPRVRAGRRRRVPDEHVN